jgi:hypothetical protein
MAVTVRLRSSGGHSADPNLVQANCLAEDLVGDLVYVSGPMVDGLPQVTKIDILDRTKMPVFGILESKTSDTDCVVRTGGIAAGLAEGLIPQHRLFAGDDGRISQAVPPRPAEGLKLVQPMGIAIDESTFLLRIGSTIGISP